MATSVRHTRIHVSLLVGAVLLSSTCGALATTDERRVLRISVQPSNWESNRFVHNERLPDNVIGIGKRLQKKWETLSATPAIQANSRLHFKLEIDQQNDRLVLQDGAPAFNVLIFVKRIKGAPGNLAYGFGPRGLASSKMYGVPRSQQGNTAVSFDWTDLRLLKGEDTEIPATFEYRSKLLKSPYIVVCGPPACTSQDLSEIQEAIAPGEQTGAPPDDKPGSRPAKPKLSGVTLWIVEQNGQPSAMQPRASIASNCIDRRKRGSEKQIVGFETVLNLPEGHVAPSACVIIKSLSEVCWPIRVSSVVQIPAAALNAAFSGLACPPDNESVEIVFKVVAAKQAAGKSPQQLREAAREQDLREIRLLSGGQVSFLSKPLISQTVDVPVSLLNEMNGLADEEARRKIPLTFATGNYGYVRPYLQTGSFRRRVELILIEQFSRLGDLEFKPVNSNNVFEENCIPLLTVPRGARLNSKEWESAMQTSRDALDGAAVKLNINSNPPARYYFRDNLPSLPLALADDEMTGLKIRFSPDDKSCIDYGSEFPVPRSAFLGVPFSPTVHKARPYFLAIGTRNPQAAKDAGLTQILETNFWQAALRGISVLERRTAPPHGGAKSRYAQTSFAFWLAPQSPVRNWPSRGDPLLPSENAIRDLTSTFTALWRNQDPGQPLFDFRNQLRDALAQLTGTSAVAESKSPNARILLLGPRLASSESACGGGVKTPLHDELASWLQRGNARLVFIEVHDSSKLPPDTTTKQPSYPSHLWECNLPLSWRPVARAFLVGTDGLIDARVTAIFDSIALQAESFYGVAGDD